VLLSLEGCASAERLSEGHLAYNEAVRQAADQELLLNIVRLRYLDTIEFLANTSINSTISFSINVDASVARSGGDTSSGAGFGARYSSTPSFSFVPQRGESFASRLTEPVGLDTLVLLVSANRDPHTIFRLMVSWMNGLDNREGSVDPRFVEATRALTGLQLAGEALFGFSAEERPVTPPMPAAQVSPSAMLQAHAAGLAIGSRAGGGEIVFSQKTEVPTLFVAEGAPERARLFEWLRLDPDATVVTLRERARTPGEERARTIWLETRSLLHVMAFLSQGVEVPGQHLAAGLASSSWPHPAIESVPMDDLFRAWASVNKPADAVLAVRHRGTWFYIRDSDQVTKRTFFVIAEAFRLLLEHDASRAPVLTLPVGGNG
jgi:hypothetical protein